MKAEKTAPQPVPEMPAARGGPLPASYLTHELRAPVTAIRLGLEILQEQIQGRLEADERHMLCVAVRNTTRLEGLVNDIMDYSKLMAGRLGVHREPCSARRLAAEAVDGLQAMAVSRGIRLVKEGGEPLPRVHADRRRVIQVLTNLIANALKFTPPRGTVTVSVRPGRHEHEGTLVFKVKDTGRGIPSGELESVFDRFAQSSLNAKASEGTGLGLTLARLMVGLHGGRIWAESWKGLGATFYFTIPIARQDLAEKVEVYPRPVQYHGLLVGLMRRLNAWLALIV